MTAIQPSKNTVTENLAVEMHDYFCSQCSAGNRCGFVSEIHNPGPHEVHNWNGPSHVRYFEAAQKMAGDTGLEYATKVMEALSAAMYIS